MKLIATVLFAFSLSYAIGQTYKDSIKTHRKHYAEEFLTDDYAPLKGKDINYLRFYKANPKYRVVAKIQLSPSAKPFDMPTHSGVNKAYVEYAVATFNLLGNTFNLILYQSLQHKNNPTLKDYLFLPFTDVRNGSQTYGGGRYLDFKTGDITNNQLVIDFNKAYNPYCAYKDGYSCPIPPKENDLSIEVKAGEKLFGKKVAKADH